MRVTRFVAAAALAVSAFAVTPASAGHDALCHGDEDFIVGNLAGVDNPTTGPQQGVIACVYVGSTRLLVGVGDNTSSSHHCITVYYAVGSAFLGCYL